MEPMIIIFGVILLTFIFAGVKIVPQQEAWIVERLGKYNKTLEAGLTLILPFIDRVAYKHSLKEQAIDVMSQTAISRDNVTLSIDGIVYVKIIDPTAASYGVSDPYLAIIQLAQTTMRSEIGKLDLDKTFEEREHLNANIVSVINEAALNWGIQCLRYEIRDIHPPQSVLNAMELQVAAERKKRADILSSEGQRQSKINIAEADKTEIVLESEAAMTDKINRAKGEAEAIIKVAEATAKGITSIAESIKQKGGSEAVSLKVAEQYMDAFKNLASTNNSIIVPANINDASSMIAQALTVYNNISDTKKNIHNEKKSAWDNN